MGGLCKVHHQGSSAPTTPAASTTTSTSTAQPFYFARALTAYCDLVRQACVRSARVVPVVYRVPTAKCAFALTATQSSTRVRCATIDAYPWPCLWLHLRQCQAHLCRVVGQ